MGFQHRLWKSQLFAGSLVDDDGLLDAEISAKLMMTYAEDEWEDAWNMPGGPEEEYGEGDFDVTPVTDTRGRACIRRTGVLSCDGDAGERCISRGQRRRGRV